MRILLHFSRLIDGVNDRLGLLANWAVVLSCAISAANAMSRYAYDASSNAWLEVQWYLFTAVVMLGASHTLRKNEHVRVDLLYMRLTDRGKEWLDLIGTAVFLLPTMALLAYLSWPQFHDSWHVQETSSNAGGLIRWPVKLLLPVGFCFVALQGVSEVIKRVSALRGEGAFEIRYERPLQ